MKYVPGFAVLCSAITVTAWSATYNLGPNCALKHFVANQWQAAQSTQIVERIQDPIVQKNNSLLFKIRDQWFSTPVGCLSQNSSASRTTRTGKESQAKWFFDLNGGLAMLMGGAYQANSSSVASYPYSAAGASVGANLGLSVGYRLGRDLTLQYFFNRVTTSQLRTFNGTAVGSLLDTKEFYHFGAGILKHFSFGPIKPFVGIALGYSLDSGLYTLTGFSSGFANFNGGVDTSGNGFYYHLHAGFDWFVTDQISIFPDVSYETIYYGSEHVNVSTSSLYQNAQQLPSINDPRILVSVGVRYWL